METRRGWPWKKKVSEKIAFASLELRQNNEHLDTDIQFKDQSEKDGMSLLQQAEAKIEVLAQQIYTKDEMILQHAKVSEEAILGWEKAESEITNIKQELNAETHKRLATEDHVSQLQRTLREYMNQLQNLQEKNEEKIHDMVLQKTREWKKVCEESQEKINKLRNDLLAAEAENFAMNELLQERAKTIEDAKEARNRIEEEVRLLQIKLESAEKSLTNWKYEMYLIRKEFDIRNEELKSSKKISEVANKQHLKNMKTIAKLESECERMQIFVRKKLQGSDVIAQTRIDVGSGLNTERGQQRPPPRINQAKHDQGLVNLRNLGCDMDGFDHPILAMVDENKALRESLYRSKREHKDVRMLCTRLSSKQVDQRRSNLVTRFNGISKFEGPTNNFSSEDQNMTYNEEHSVISIFKDGIVHGENNGLELWANALESELARLNKKKKCTTSSISDISMQSPSSFALMDDFAEMEKFASMSNLHKDSELEMQSHIDSDQESDVVIKNLCHQLPIGVSNCRSEESISKQDVSLESINGKETSRELALAMNKVVSLIEVLSQDNYNAESSLNETSSYKQNHVFTSSEFKSCVQSLITLCNCFLHDEVDIMDFLAEVASALDWILNYTFSLNGPQITNVQISNLRSVCDSKKTTLEERSLDIHDHRTICSDVDITRFHSLEKQLKLEKDATKEKWALLKEEVAALKARLEISSINAAELKSSLSSAMETKGSLKIDMEKFVALTNELESHLSDAKEDLKKLEVQDFSLKLPLQDYVQCDKDVKIMHKDILDRQSRSTGETDSKIAHNRVTLSQTSTESSTTKKEKEKDMEATTKKLEECRHTALSIEKQLNDLGEASDNLTQNSPYTRSPLNNPKTHMTLKTIIDYDDHDDYVKIVGNHESIPQSISHGNQNVFVSSPSPGRFLSLEAWENQEAFHPCSPSISAAKKRENGAKGLGRFFTKNRASKTLKTLN